MSNQLKEASGLTKRMKYYALGILTLVYTFNFIDRQILVILQPLIKAELDLSDTQLGLLSGIAFAAFYTILGIPIARLADKKNRRNIIAISLTVWSAMTALSGLAQTYLHLLLARLGVGVGEAGGSPPAHSMISDMFSPKKRATALAIYSAGLYFGIVLGYSFGGYLGITYGWRTTFMLVGLPGIVLALILWLTVKEPKRGQFDQVGDKTAPTLKETFSYILNLKSFAFIAFGSALSAFVSYGISNFMPSFLFRYHLPALSDLASSFGFQGENDYEIAYSMMGILLGVVGGGAGIIGTFLGGYLTDKIGAKDARWYLWLPGITAVIAVPFAVASFHLENLKLILLFIFIFNVMGTLYLPPSIAVLHRLVEPRMRAMSSAILFFVLNLIGLGLGPVFVGWLSDFLTKTNGYESLHWALSIGAGVALIKGFLFWRGGISLTTDLKNIEK